MSTLVNFKISKRTSLYGMYQYEQKQYKIDSVEIEKSATDKELKSAHRKMVKKHHPDKVKHLGDEQIKKERGI